MPDLTVRVFYMQLNKGVAEVPFSGIAPEKAARLVLAAVDPGDDEGEERRYQLPDGRRIEIDPEDMVDGSRVYCQVLDSEGAIIGLFGDLTPCDVTRGPPMVAAGRELRPLVADIRTTAEEYLEMGRDFPLTGLGNLFEHLDALTHYSSHGPASPTEEAPPRTLLTVKERATVLTGLRLVSERGVPPDMMNVATEGGRLEIQTRDEVDELCQRPALGHGRSKDTTAVMSQLVDLHHELSGLEEDNGTEIRIWHLLLSLLKLGNSQGIDIDRIWKRVQAEAPSLLDDAT